MNYTTEKTLHAHGCTFVKYSVIQFNVWLLNYTIVSIPTPCPCSARATTCKPQEICGPTLVSRWTLPPFIPHPSALATRATCAPSAPSVRLAASARWVSNACMAQRQHLETWTTAYAMLLYVVASGRGNYRDIKHPHVSILEVHSWLFSWHSLSQLKS